jgi:GT2 family glycosyltransferase
VLVSAVVVVRDGSTWLAECLDSIAAQTVRPTRLVIVDVGSSDTSLAIATAHRAVRQTVRDVSVLEAASGLSLAAAVEFGIAALTRTGDPGQEWIWVVHDGAAARASTLEQLLGAVRRSPSVGVAGPKIVGWDEPRRLVEIGIQITRSGRRIASPARGEADQGQHDGRTDVLAVGTSGMLVRRDVFDELGGFDPAFETYGAGLDFGWRAQLAGHRVIVVPSAAYRDASLVDLAQPGRPRLGEIDRRNRRAARQAALARSAPLAAPFLALWMALSAIVSSVTLLVAKRPRRAWRELADLSALFHPVATTRARWRGRPTRRLRRSALATLFVSPSAAARITLDHIQDAITPERVRRREAALTTETGPVGDTSESLDVLPASLPRRIATHPGFLAVVATVVATVVAWRDAIAAGALSPSSTGLAGAELRPVTTDSAGLWHAFRDAWHGAGLGTGADSSPYLAVLAGLTWVVERLPGTEASRSPAGLTIAALLFVAPALSAWAAYLASRVVTPARVPRALVALAWGTSATLTSALAQGRVTAAVAHLLLPFVLAGFVLAARRDGTYTAAFATALATAVVGAFVPVLLAVAALAALLLLVLGPGRRRWRALVLLIVPAALLGPWAAHFAEDWRALLSGPGLVATGPAPASWMSALGLADPMTGPWAWLAAPVLLLGVAGYAVRSDGRSESVGLAVGAIVAVLGLAGTLAAARVGLGSAETTGGGSGPPDCGPDLSWTSGSPGCSSGSCGVAQPCSNDSAVRSDGGRSSPRPPWSSSRSCPLSRARCAGPRRGGAARSPWGRPRCPPSRSSRQGRPRATGSCCSSPPTASSTSGWPVRSPASCSVTSTAPRTSTTRLSCPRSPRWSAAVPTSTAASSPGWRSASCRSRPRRRATSRDGSTPRRASAGSARASRASSGGSVRWRPPREPPASRSPRGSGSSTRAAACSRSSRPSHRTQRSATSSTQPPGTGGSSSPSRRSGLPTPS